ncbi:hypothetical protein [Methylobacterium aquaticum]|uniref:Phage protein, HK97 gp10 family n=1 Tax=Methylobacterium aquaticum TaxID=270351 RepID=A0A0J6SKX8_9HYPH|nr:hypothetical protein [Methylobacterium aquaticum]KMO34324.1 hypothetical protein VP06_14765 [Methylobacterium aquaticum]
MGSFNQFASLLREIARHPTQAEQKQARHAGLGPFVEAARSHLAANGSNKSGQLSGALGIAEKTKDTSAAGPIKGKKHWSVGVLVELGTAPHYQPNRNGGQWHPGARPSPFMRPAYEETKDEIVEEAARSLAQSIFGRSR